MTWGCGPGVEEDLRNLRELLDEMERRLDALETVQSQSSVALAVQTTSLGSYPTSGASLKTFACTVLDVFSPDTEGGTAGTAGGSGNIFAVNLASGLPANGTKLVVDQVPNAYVFNYK